MADAPLPDSALEDAAVPRAPGLWIGVDIGGTFTDLVALREDGASFVEKLLSTTDDYSRAIAEGVARLLVRADRAPGSVMEVVHGTTIATNAILQGKGARTGLITTRGFRDVLDIRRSRRPDMYDIAWRKPPVLVERYLRLEVRERLDCRGECIETLDMDDVAAAIDILRSEQVESVAVCLINAFANGVHERVIGERLARDLPEVSVSLSSEVLPEAKEYERTSTTCINAYVRPVVQRYMRRLGAHLREMGIAAPLLTMQSNGGIVSAGVAAERPIHIVESGPAAGVIGARALARRMGLAHAIAFDMGGTTAKASLIDGGEIQMTMDLEVGAGLSAVSRLNKGGGYALSTPSVDVAEVGVGGGSIAWLDSTGTTHVGPESAGADPGPACYNLGGTRPTVTDANLLLGYLNPAFLVGGHLALSPAKALEACEAGIARSLGTSVPQAAYGVRSVVNASMTRAIRAISTERGRDPRDAVLIAFGGNGPVHAADLARELGMRTVIIPASPGVFSAFGLLDTDIEHAYSRTHRAALTPGGVSAMGAAFAELQSVAQADVHDAGYGEVAIEWIRRADIGYRSQASHLVVPVPDEPLQPELATRLRAAFEAEHERIFGYRSPEEAVEIINLRLSARIRSERPSGRRPDIGGDRQPGAPRRTRSAYFGPHYGTLEASVVDRAALGDQVLAGPAIVEQYDSTIVVPPGATLRADEWGSLCLRIAESGNRAALPENDGVTREIVRHALESLADEMALTIVRTCRSGHVKHSGDFSTAIADAEGRLLAQGVTSPFHLGALPDALAVLVTRFRGRIDEGDVFMLNDPFGGGMHLPDVFLIKPVFHEARLLAFAATIVHQIDIGGRVAGGNSTLNTEVYSEGIRLPLLKLYEKGRLNEGVFEVFRANVRVPEKVIGDIRAQLSACDRGARDYLALVERYGAELLAKYQSQLLDASEAAARETIRGIPDGIYEFEDYLDGDSIDPAPVAINVVLGVDGDTVTVDCRKSSPQVRGGINSTMSVTRSMAYTALRCLMPAHTSSNSGYMRPIRVLAEPGSVLDAVMPAASGGRAVTGYRLMDVVFGALAKAVPEIVMAAGDGSPVIFAAGGSDDDGRPFVLVDLLRGSWGATATGDGLDGTTLACSTGSSIPAEILELEHPVRMEYCGYVPDACGHGQFRGGMAVMRDIRLLTDRASVQYRSERRKYLPWGLQGGGPGTASVVVADPLGAAALLPEKGETRMRRGDLLRLCQSGGGGYGDPLLRDPQAVRRDVRDGLITPVTARDVYGIVLAPDNATVDEAQTADRRNRVRSTRTGAASLLTAVPACEADIAAMLAATSSLRNSEQNSPSTIPAPERI